MTERQGEPNNSTAAVHPGYPNQISGFDWIMLFIIASFVMIVAINSLVFWWLMGRTLLGLVVGAGFPIFVASLFWWVREMK